MCANGHNCKEVHVKISKGSTKKAYQEACKLLKTMTPQDARTELEKRIKEIVI